jgi:hypothetical protein
MMEQNTHCRHAPRTRGIQYSRAADIEITSATEYWIVRFRGR